MDTCDLDAKPQIFETKPCLATISKTNCLAKAWFQAQFCFKIHNFDSSAPKVLETTKWVKLHGNHGLAWLPD